MIGEPHLENRIEQQYVGIRSRVSIPELPNAISESLGELFGWLGKHGVAPAGAPILRFHVINMETKMEVELGVPVTRAMSGEGLIAAGVLPAGRYAVLFYRGVQNAIPATAALLDWGANQGLVWDKWDDPNGDAFGARYEKLLTGPDDDPDPANWDNEVAIRLADG